MRNKWELSIVQSGGNSIALRHLNDKARRVRMLLSYGAPTTSDHYVHVKNAHCSYLPGVLKSKAAWIDYCLDHSPFGASTAACSVSVAL